MNLTFMRSENLRLLVDAVRQYNEEHAAYCATTAGKEEIEAATFLQNAFLECSEPAYHKMESIKCLDGAFEMLQNSFILYSNLSSANITFPQFRNVALFYEEKHRQARLTTLQFSKERRAASVFREVVEAMLKRGIPYLYIQEILESVKGVHGEKMSDNVLSLPEHLAELLHKDQDLEIAQQVSLTEAGSSSEDSELQKAKQKSYRLWQRGSDVAGPANTH